jgi:hypothetical protein
MYAVIYENVISGLIPKGYCGVASRSGDPRLMTKEEAEELAVTNKRANPGTKYYVVKVIAEATEMVTYGIVNKQ